MQKEKPTVTSCRLPLKLVGRIQLMTSLNLAVQERIVDPQPLPVIEWKALRVVTTETLASGYGTDDVNIRMNLSNNKDRFIEGVHYLHSFVIR